MNSQQPDNTAKKISQFDLPGYIQTTWPNSRLRTKDKGWNLCHAVWRSQDKQASFGLIRQSDRWFWQDYATGDKGGPVEFLTMAHGWNRKTALEFICGPAQTRFGKAIDWSNILPEQPKEPVTASQSTQAIVIQASAELARNGLPATAQDRCWDITLCELVDMGRGYTYWSDGKPSSLQYKPSGEDFILPMFF